MGFDHSGKRTIRGAGGLAAPVNHIEPVAQRGQARCGIGVAVDGVVGFAAEGIERGGGLAEGGGQQEGGSEERARAAAQGLTAIREVGVQRLQGLGLFGQRTGVHRA